MDVMIKLVMQSTWQTLVMVFLSTIFSLILGLPVGVLLHITGKEETGGIIPRPLFNSVLSRIVNILQPGNGNRHDGNRDSSIDSRSSVCG